MLSGAPRPGAVADAEGLPLADASVDVVVLSAVLEHVLDPRRAVAEAKRVLRPGGRLVVYVPWDKAAIALKRWARRIGIGLGELSEGSAPGHLRAFDRRGLTDLLGGTCRVRFDPLSLGYYAEVER
jgi:SAM-dependent methyltransferase